MISIINCSEDYVRTIQSSMHDIIPYLEGLCDLRYYPVPTLIVDEYTLKEVNPNFYEKNDDMDPLLREDTKEILRFISAVCLTFHTGAFSPREYNIRGNDYYGGFSKLPYTARQKLVGYAEVTYGLPNFLNTGSINSKYCYIPEISSVKDSVSNCMDNLTAILGILKEISSKYKGEVVLSSRYFRDPENPPLPGWEDRCRDRSKKDVWKRRLTKSQFDKIKKNIDENGLWKKDLESVIEVFEVALEAIFKLLRKWLSRTSAFSPIIRELHTYGVYIHPSETVNGKLNRLLRRNGFPHWFNLQNTGKVVICLDSCNEHIKQCLKNDHTIDEKEMLRKLVTATLVHEHAHAITYEGIGSLAGEEFFEGPKSGGKRFKVVSEALAEWAALNYFRNDKTAFNIVVGHASCGEFPDWPYTAALLIERAYKNYRSLLKLFRKDYKKAYKLLRTF